MIPVRISRERGLCTILMGRKPVNLEKIVKTDLTQTFTTPTDESGKFYELRTSSGKWEMTQSQNSTQGYPYDRESIVNY